MSSRANPGNRCRIEHLLLGALWVAMLVACGREAPDELKQDLLTTGQKLYSQNDEELIIRDFFDDQRRVFFLDIGCYDYKNHSTTYYL